jgi:hypothetical protein
VNQLSSEQLESIEDTEIPAVEYELQKSERKSSKRSQHEESDQSELEIDPNNRVALGNEGEVQELGN